MFKRAQEDEYDRERALRAMIAVLKASSLEGVAIQLSETLTLTGFLQDDYPEAGEPFRSKKTSGG
ncbi:hypothetical protein HFN53_07640 [Rhizobium leguminosarum]|uniref:hypothetical protein n=1 Tax=Rhizobium ruizarguesonis TaxID=2081791 RepID=UPI00103155F8|nr:hypothetical protein [Rhizobium ruizarguesonis]MBY5871889.1 hypothetical protein [Rhizobium leguminosarum]TBC69489.1 hypothetical protein ELH30_30075 [Rhizobium ruizarguesonis]